jgi:hypothetical protein
MLPAGKNLRRPGVHRVQHTGLDGLHIVIALGLDARVTQGSLRILYRAVLLQIGAQSTPHHLEGNKTVRDT